MNHSEAGKLGAIKTHKTLIERYEKSPRICLSCGKILPYELRKNKFCGHSCAATYNNTKNTHDRAKFWRTEYDKNPKSCKKCGKVLDFQDRHRKCCSLCYDGFTVKDAPKTTGFCLNCDKPCNRKFCCGTCHNDYVWENLKIEMERTGKARALGTAKRYLKEKYDKCQICGISDWHGNKLPLILDHVDGNSENWKLSNLRLICSNCDSTLPTYKGRNKGKGRFSRRLRYQQGKSY